MADECTNSIWKNLSPNSKPIKEVIWTGPNKQVTEDQLNGDSFLTGVPFYLICPVSHCTDDVDQSPSAHALCNCRNGNGDPIPGCTPPSALYPVKGSICLDVDDPKKFNGLRSKNCTKQTPGNWYQLTCYCCCSCFANGTRISVPLGSRPIEYFQTGDEVLVAHMENGKPKWVPGLVASSMGTGDTGYQPRMVYLHYGDDDRQMIVTTDGLFLLSTGKLKRADRLVPGIDQLVNQWGDAVPIHELSIGEYLGGVHHISTNAKNLGSIDGHLILSEGVISGDFALQVSGSTLVEQALMDDPSTLPVIGTREYELAYPQLAKEYYGISQVTALADGQRAKMVKPQKFYLHGERAAAIPDTAASYLDEAQANDVYNNAPRWDFDDIGVNGPVVKYTLKLFKAFFPDYNFYCDQGEVIPNAYAFDVAGVRNIVITGGLTRLKNMDQEGLSFILVHMIAAAARMAPVGDNGWTSVAMADYYSISMLMTIYFGKSYGNIYKPGLKQLEECIFKYITKENDNYVNDPYKPSIDTRLDAIDAGNAMTYPPEGIGGPQKGGLKVVGAKVFPPMVGIYSFVTPNIDDAQSDEVFKLLVQNEIISNTGEVVATFDMNTSLDFLFTEVEDVDQRSMMIGEVRSALLHARSLIELEFNDQVNVRSGDSAYNYSLDNGGIAFSAEVKLNFPVVEIVAELKRDITYTLTVSSHVLSTIGSSLDPAQRTATFKI